MLLPCGRSHPNVYFKYAISITRSYNYVMHGDIFNVHYRAYVRDRNKLSLSIKDHLSRFVGLECCIRAYFDGKDEAVEVIHRHTDTFIKTIIIIIF